MDSSTNWAIPSGTLADSLNDWLTNSFIPFSSLFLIDLGKSRDYCIPRGVRSRVSRHSSTLHVERSLHLSNYFDWQPRFDSLAHGCTQQPLRCCRISFGTGKWKTQCSLCPERLKISAKQNTSVLNNYFFFVATALDSEGTDTPLLLHSVARRDALLYFLVCLVGLCLCGVMFCFAVFC